MFIDDCATIELRCPGCASENRPSVGRPRFIAGSSSNKLFASPLKKTSLGILVVLSMVLLVTANSVWAVTPGKTPELQFDLTGRQLYSRPLFGSAPPFVTYGGDLPAFAVSGGWYGGKLGNL